MRSKSVVGFAAALAIFNSISIENPKSVVVVSHNTDLRLSSYYRMRLSKSIVA